MDECRLALLPPAAGYPALLDTVVTAGFAWTLTTRLAGRSLGDAWAGLSWEERVLPFAVCGSGRRLFQLDLNHLVKCAFGPEDNARSRSDEDIQGLK